MTHVCDCHNHEPSTPGQVIEEESFRLIDRELEGRAWDDFTRGVARRVIHATADFSFADSLRVHPAARERGLAALREGRPVICDVMMLAAGLTRIANPVFCAIDEPETHELAQVEKITRAAAAMRRLALELDGAIVAIGNAPTALREVMALTAAGVPAPALVIGMPVGFVGAAESKEELLRSGLVYLTSLGPRGGSPVAAAAVNALAGMLHGS